MSVSQSVSQPVSQHGGRRLAPHSPLRVEGAQLVQPTTNDSAVLQAHVHGACVRVCARVYTCRRAMSCQGSSQCVWRHGNIHHLGVT